MAFDGFGPFAEAVLLCLFIYWGWDALITVNEETKDKDKTPGRAAVISTVLLLGTYLFTAFAAISFAGTGTDGLGLGNADNAADVLATLGPPVLGTALAKVVELAICVSAISALLTCVISSPRTTLSMGSHGALPKAFTRIHPKFQTPAFGTVFFGAAAAVLLAVLATVSDQLPRRRHPVDRPADRVLLRSHRSGVRLVLPPSADRLRCATCSSRASCPRWAG